MSHFSENDHRKTRCFQHRGVNTRGVSTTCFPFFSTLPAFCPVLFSPTVRALLPVTFSLKKYRVPALNTRKVEGTGLICTHIPTWFQHGACVSTSCIPALTASFSRYPSPLKNVRRYCILALMPRKSISSTNSSILFCMNPYCVPAFSACISIASGGFLDCFWAAQRSRKLSGLL